MRGETQEAHKTAELSWHTFLECCTRHSTISYLLDTGLKMVPGLAVIEVPFICMGLNHATASLYQSLPTWGYSKYPMSPLDLQFNMQTWKYAVDVQEKTKLPNLISSIIEYKLCHLFKNYIVIV
jgi:hypothetical protein